MAPAPRVIKELGGAGKVYDWRGTGLLPPNGGRIRLQGMIEHIPVVPNAKGTGDFVTLANILKGKGLSLQAATDSEGNVALYNPLDVLCYQARGANQITGGVEHMHMSIGEDWSRKQLRASAWLWQYAEREYGIPMRVGKVVPAGPGLCRFARTGHTSHQAQAAAAGYHDRSDPGAKYDWAYVRAAAEHFKLVGHFDGF